MSKSMNTASSSSDKGSMTESLTERPSLLTCVSSWSPVQPNNIEELRTWLQRDSHASPSQDLGKSSGKTITEICGLQLSTSFAQYDLDTRSWRTSQESFLTNTYDEFSETWPKAGLMQDGMCWELQASVEINLENEFGLWPTLKASDHSQLSKNLEYYKKRLKTVPDLPVIVALSTPPSADGIYARLNPEWAELLNGLPIGWTGLRPLETDKILEWLQLHGNY